MQVIYCDFCDVPIKGRRYLLAVLKEDEQEALAGIYSVEDLARNLNQYQEILRQVEKRELCQKCYEIILMLFNERKKALRKTVQEIKALYKLVDKGDSKSKKKT